MKPTNPITFSTQAQVAQAFHCSHYQARLVEHTLQKELPCEMNPLEALAILHDHRIETHGANRGYMEK